MPPLGLPSLFLQPSAPVVYLRHANRTNIPIIRPCAGSHAASGGAFVYVPGTGGRDYGRIRGPRNAPNQGNPSKLLFPGRFWRKRTSAQPTPVSAPVRVRAAHCVFHRCRVFFVRPSSGVRIASVHGQARTQVRRHETVFKVRGIVLAGYFAPKNILTIVRHDGPKQWYRVFALR